MNRNTTHRLAAVAMTAAVSATGSMAAAHAVGASAVTAAAPIAVAPTMVAPATAAPITFAPATPAAQATTALPALAPYVQTLLIFGTIRPDGGPAVTKHQFKAFVDHIVTPRFPDGLSVSEVQGQWRDQHGIVEHEHSYETYLLYPAAQTTEKNAAIEQIRDLYKQRFAQESVARVDEPAQVSF